VIHHYPQDTKQSLEYLKNQLTWSYSNGVSGRQYCNMGADYLFDSEDFQDGQPIVPSILKIMKSLNTNFSVAMNAAYASFYEDGESELLFRNDKEQQIDLNQPIFILSYGGSRYITFKDIETHEEYDFLLKDGDLCIMSENSQVNYVHGVKKSTEFTEPRLALSFRRFHNW
ncbi:MAG: alpha-ketoglutarate-dependent dioxygenase AlkB, partial [Candidatus Saccharibacteria bacterium]|nr:alpha-ketoglutarate-dependent dioxygenase AlkB [Moraxellaceae bacterium]